MTLAELNAQAGRALELEAAARRLSGRNLATALVLAAGEWSKVPTGLWMHQYPWQLGRLDFGAAWAPVTVGGPLHAETKRVMEGLR